MFVNQIQNFVAAIVWFNYWADNGQEMLVWAVAAYAGYAVGLNAARNGGLPVFRRPSP